MKTAPHEVLGDFTADEVAECWPCSPQLYQFLWNEIVPRHKKINYEDCGPSDVIGVNAISLFWEHIPENFQNELNELASLE